MADDPVAAGADALDRAAKKRRERAEEERDAAFKRVSKEIGEGADVRPEDVFPKAITLEDALQELVFLGDGAAVSSLKTPKVALTFDQFQKLTAASRMPAPGRDGRSTVRPVASVWLEHGNRITVHTRTFAPGCGRITRSPEGFLALNLWHPPAPIEAPADWPERASHFLQHVYYLIPDDDLRGRFLDWLAHVEKHPGELPHHHYLMVANAHGIGRNLLASWLARVWAGTVALSVDLTSILRGGWNSDLSCKTFAVVDELHEVSAGDRTSVYRAAENLKSLVTREEFTVNPKYGRTHREFNRIRWLLLSNHDGALFLDERDRRFVVVRNPDQPQSAEYYAAQYARCNDPLFIASIRQMLRERDLEGFSCGWRPPMNQAKKDVVMAGKSDADIAVTEFSQWWPGPVAAASDLRRFVFGGDDDDRTSRRESASLQHSASRAGMKPLNRRIRIAGVRERVWSLRDHEAWSAASNSKVASDVETARKAAKDLEAREVAESIA
jgi:hypothetical protein